MKANELMIGDWVYVGNEHPIKVVRNYGRSVMYEDESSHEAEESWLNPIPLTEEMLKANGFERKEQYRCWVLNSDCAISLHTDFVEKNEFRISIFSYAKAIKYVHELQHALRLVGLNELADNFKLPQHG